MRTPQKGFCLPSLFQSAGFLRLAISLCSRLFIVLLLTSLISRFLADSYRLGYATIVRPGCMFLLVKQLARLNVFTQSFHASATLSSKRTGAAAQYARRQLKDYQFPEIRNEDCEQNYISGWGNLFLILLMSLFSLSRTRRTECEQAPECRTDSS